MSESCNLVSHPHGAAAKDTRGMHAEYLATLRATDAASVGRRSSGAGVERRSNALWT